MSAACLLAVFAVDALFRTGKPPLLVEAALDESAHLATTALCFLPPVRYLQEAPRLRRRFAVAALAASVLIDLDHVPLQIFGSDVLSRGTVRPHVHSLVAPFLALALSVAVSPPRHAVLLGVAFGFSAHLLRDAATGGVPLFWPVTPHAMLLPYADYAVIIAVPSAWAWLRRSDITPRRGTAKGHDGARPPVSASTLPSEPRASEHVRYTSVNDGEARR